jgi:tryptophan-rich sensory protein
MIVLVVVVGMSKSHGEEPDVIFIRPGASALEALAANEVRRYVYPRTTVAFYPVSMLAAFLFTSYWLWVSLATLLNAGIWWLNRN